MPGLDDVHLPVQKDYEQHCDDRLPEMPAGMHARPRRLAPLIAAMLCRWALLVLCVVSPCASALAQDAAVAAGPSPGQTAAPAEAASPTPGHIAKARELILATGISRSFQIIIPEFMDQIGTTVTQSRPDLVHDMDLVLVQLKPEFEHQSEEMIDQSARIYAALLSESDIDSILAFFNSDAGKRYVGAQPFFLNQLVSGMQAWQQKISINMMARVREEMKKKGHDL